MPAEKSKSRGPAALFVALGILLSRIAGLIRERAFAHYLGNSDAAGAFRAALRIPNLLQNLFGEGVLSASFIPVYARLLGEGKEEEAGKVAGITFSFLTLLVSAIVLIGVFATDFLVDVLVPGFEGEVRNVTRTLVQIMFPGTGLLVLSAWCLGILNSHRRFFLSYVAPVVWNVAMIVALLAYGARYASDQAGQMELVKLVAWSTVVGSLVQFGVQLPTALKLNHGLNLGFSYKPVAVVIQNFFPALLSRGVIQLSAYIDQILASYLGPMVLSAMAYAQTIYLLPISLFGMAITSAELPEFARTTGTHEERGAALNQRLAKGLRKVSFFIIPSGVAFIALGNVVAGTIFQTGNFTAEDSYVVWLILAGSSLGLLANSRGRLCVSVFWAMHDSKTPAWYAFYRVLLSATLGYLIVFPLREHYQLNPARCAAGMTAATGISAWVEYYLIRYSLKKRIGNLPSDFNALGLFWLAGVLAAGASYAVQRFLPPMYPAISGIIVLGVFGAVYLGITLAFGNAEAKHALSPILKRR